MGRRGEIFTRKVFVKEGEKTYFFNIKENRFGDMFLNLVESSKRDIGGFQRNSIMIYMEDLYPFMEGFTQAHEHLTSQDKKKFSLEQGRETARRKFHFSVKWNKAGYGSMLIAEERVGQDEDRKNETIFIDERDLDDFMMGFKPVIARMREEKKK